MSLLKNKSDRQLDQLEQFADKGGIRVISSGGTRLKKAMDGTEGSKSVAGITMQHGDRPYRFEEPGRARREPSPPAPPVHLNAFVSTWRTNAPGESLLILEGLESDRTYDCTVDWGDGVVENLNGHDDPKWNHTYANAGDHTVIITGVFGGFKSEGNWGEDFLNTLQKLISITSIGQVGWTDFNGAFHFARNLTSFSIGDYEVVATDVVRMFSNCSNLKFVDIAKLDISNLTTLAEMFHFCQKLPSLDVSEWDISNIVSLNGLFRGCSALQGLDVSNWNTSNVEDMSFLFHSCMNVPLLDVSNFDTSKVENMMGAFYGCVSLSSLDVSNFDTSNVKSMEQMFAHCTNLVSLDVSNFDTSNVTSMKRMFDLCTNLVSLDLSNFDTSNVTTMSSMFSQTNNLQNLDLSGWDTSSVEDMTGMFAWSGGFSDFGSLDVSSVKLMGQMFFSNRETHFDLSSWNTSNVENMAGMFAFVQIESLNTSGWDTSKVVFMSGMFNSYPLPTIDISHFDMSSVVSFDTMFSGASLEVIPDIPLVSSSVVTTVSGMFADIGDGLTGVAPEFWNSTNFPNLSAPFNTPPFRGATGLSNYEDIPANWK